MATDQRSLPAFFNSDGDFQTWIQGIQAQLAAAGTVVKTSDTGQINSATVTRAGTSTAAGYEIYKFQDSMQASFPVFFKIEYGQGAVADRPSLWITVGTGSNGSGTISTQVGTRKQIFPAVSKTAGATLTSYCCGRPDGIGLYTHYDPATNTFAYGFFIERSKDGSGNNTTDCILTYMNTSSGNGGQIQAIPYAGTVPGVQAAGPGLAIALILGGGVSVFGANVALIPWITLLGKVVFGMMLCSFRAADITQQNAVVVNNLGSNHTYMPLTSITVAAFGADGSGTGQGCCMLWE